MDEKSEEFITFLMGFGNFMKKMFQDEFDINGNKKEFISHNQFGIIHAIGLLKSGTITELEALMPVSKSALSIGLAKLERAGYVVRRYPKFQEDRRHVYFENTDKASEVIHTTTKNVINKYQLFYEGLSEKNKSDFKNAINTLNNIFATEIK